MSDEFDPHMVERSDRMVTRISILYLLGATALFLFGLYSLPALAETYLAMQFNPNVRIVLAKENCPEIPSAYKAVAQRIDKQYMRGCWKLENKMVRIQWSGSDDDFSVLDASKFYPVEVK